MSGPKSRRQSPDALRRNADVTEKMPPAIKPVGPPPPIPPQKPAAERYPYTVQKIRPGERPECPMCVKLERGSTRQVQKQATREGPKQYYVCKVCTDPGNALRAFRFVAIIEE